MAELSLPGDKNKKVVTTNVVKTNIPAIPPPAETSTQRAQRLTSAAHTEMDKYKKGQVFDPTNLSESSFHKPLTTAVIGGVVPELNKYKEKADSMYYAHKSLDPDYAGVPAKSLDSVLNGNGSNAIALQKAYQRYRTIATGKPGKEIPNLKGTPQGSLEHGVPSFGGGKATTEDLYVADPRLEKNINTMPSVAKVILPKGK